MIKGRLNSGNDLTGFEGVRRLVVEGEVFLQRTTKKLIKPFEKRTFQTYEEIDDLS